MKKILMTIAAAFVATAMSAQVYVGGNVGFSTTSHDGESVSKFSIVPEVGYNLDENWAVGIALGYSQSGKGDNKMKEFQISPYARYTFAKFNKVNLFVDGGLGYVHEDFAGEKINTFRVGFKPGVAVNLTDQLSFVAHVGFFGYQNEKLDEKGAKATHTYTAAVDRNDLTFGLYFNF